MGSRSLPALVALVLCPSIGQAVDGENPGAERLEPPPAIQWPAEPRPLSEVFYIAEKNEEGLSDKRLVLDCGKFALATTNGGRWVKSDTLNRRYSVQMSPEGDPDIVFSMARFPKNDFIQSLDQEQWSQYLTFLQSPPQSKSVTYQRYSGEKKSAPNLLGGKSYRTVEYEYADKNGTSIKVREIFAFLMEELFVFSFSGPSEKIEGLRERNNLMISRMEML